MHPNSIQRPARNRVIWPRNAWRGSWRIAYAEMNVSMRTKRRERVAEVAWYMTLMRAFLHCLFSRSTPLHREKRSATFQAAPFFVLPSILLFLDEGHGIFI